MRTFIIPNTITVSANAALTSEPPRPFSFAEFACICWVDDDRAIAGGFRQTARWVKVADALLHSEPGATVSLEDEDYATLRAIVDAPQRRLNATVAMQLLPYAQAVLEAKVAP